MIEVGQVFKKVVIVAILDLGLLVELEQKNALIHFSRVPECKSGDDLAKKFQKGNKLSKVKVVEIFSQDVIKVKCECLEI